jgi:hypothetical protein
MMGGKYSAEWWEKITGLNREISARDDPSSVIDDLIQATASARLSPARKSETPRPGFNGLEPALSQALHKK